MARDKHAGIIDQRIEPSESGLDMFEGFFDRVVVLNVDLEWG